MNTTKQAVHKHFPNQTVLFSVKKDPFGNTIYHCRFENGEQTSMSEKRFLEMFQEIK